DHRADDTGRDTGKTMNTALKILIIALLIAVLGILSIFSSTSRKEGGFFQTLYQRQILWVVLGLLSFWFFSNFNYRRLWDWTYFIYAVVILLLLLVFVLGIVRLGAQRWLKFWWLQVQPTEIAKLIVLIFLAKYFSKKSVDDVALKAQKFGLVRALVVPFVFVAIPMGLIIEQPDLGSGAIVFFIFFIMLFLSKVKLRYIVIFLLIVASLVPVSWYFLKDYQKDRIRVFLDPNIDPLGAGYTVIQSRIAIGSGGFFGKGWKEGTQSQLKFLPEAHTDFIFATFAEEWGFAGALVVIGLYFLLVRQGIHIAERTGDHYGQLLSTGIACMLCIQACINIAMTMGLAPVVGLPLPLMSYGGSSVITTFSALGIMANVSKTRAVF
ncbi:MAG: rod shape-determining protein RodA, partial [Candidatus Omnitrophica bacterium]|nr:rod shape-determining protein RodA [Candidatus Omnitrophota bacterium]